MILICAGGITQDQAERGEVLPICLMEIDRARPFFIGLLGERYGWVPADDIYQQDLLELYPWLKERRAGKSVTELEILHGVLNNPEMAGRAFFYFRSKDYAVAKGDEYAAISEEASNKQGLLKDRIRKSRFPVVEDYLSPQALADQLQDDLWKVLDYLYPANDVPDKFERDANQHEAYALPRRRLFIDGGNYIKKLDKVLGSGEQRILVEGGPEAASALLANPFHPGARAILPMTFLSIILPQRRCPDAGYNGSA